MLSVRNSASGESIPPFRMATSRKYVRREANVLLPKSPMSGCPRTINARRARLTATFRRFLSFSTQWVALLDMPGESTEDRRTASRSSPCKRWAVPLTKSTSSRNSRPNCILASRSMSLACAVNGVTTPTVLNPDVMTW